MKYKKTFLIHFEQFPIFTYNDARLFLLKGGATEVYIRKFMSLMVKTNAVLRLTKGNYTLHKDINLVGYVFKPFYYGLGTALTYHGLWEQQANLAIITTNNVREGVRPFFGLNVVIKKIPKELFFGYEKVRYETFHFYVSDVEKTFIDMVYCNFIVEEYVYKNIFRKLNMEKVNKYLKRYNKSTKSKVMKLNGQYNTK
jgi:predicted transcriptional regulator of viral defense system